MFKTAFAAISSRAFALTSKHRVDRRVTLAAQSAVMQRLENRILFGYYSADHVDEIPNPQDPNDCDKSVVNSSPNNGGTSALTSGQPIRYSDGMPSFESTDLSSDGFGFSWGQTRSWTGLNNGSPNGNGWTIAELPYLVVGGGTNGTHNGVGTPDGSDGVLSGTANDDRISIVSGGTSTLTFSVPVAGPSETYQSYTPRGSQQSSMTWNSTTRIITVTDETGNIIEFYDVHRQVDSNPSATDPNRPQPYSLANDVNLKYGQFKSFTSANGSTQVSATYDSNGYLTELTRSDSGSSAIERYVYDYEEITNDLVDAASGPHAVVLEGVSQQRWGRGWGIDQSPTDEWHEARRVDYTYYTGRISDGGSGYVDDPNGRLGDLKFATIGEPATETGISALSVSSGIATVSCNNASGDFHVGDIVVTHGADQSTYNGTFIVTAATSTTVSFAVPKDAGSISGDPLLRKVIDAKYYRYYKFTGEAYHNTTSSDPMSVTSLGPTNNSATTGGPFAFDPSWVNYGSSPLTSDDAFVMSGLKSVVEGASLSRLVAVAPDFDNAPDATIKTYCDHFYIYERWDDHSSSTEGTSSEFRQGYRMGTRYRVAEEIAQGEGCSTCSGGQGSYKFEYATNNNSTGGTLGFNQIDYNTWRIRATEFLPDTTNAPLVRTLPAGALFRSGQTVQVNCPEHRFSVGDFVTIAGASVSDCNGTFKITKIVGENTFNYQTASSGSGIVFGTVTATSADRISGASWADNDRNIVYTNEVGQPILKQFVDVDTVGKAITGGSTSFGNPVTVTCPAHGFATGDTVAISGILGSYDVVTTITVIDSDHFSYTIPNNVNRWLPFGFSTTLYQTDHMFATKVLSQQLTYYKYDSQGRLILKANPSAVTTFFEASSDLINNPSSPGGNMEGVSDSAGLIEEFSYGTSTTATTSSAGDVLGYLKSSSVRNGETGSSILLSAQNYIAHTNSGATVFPLASTTTYRNDNGTGGATTSYNYTWFSGSNQIQSKQTVYPIVTTAQNGSNSAISEDVFFDKYGRAIWTRNADGFIQHMEYDDGTGAMTLSITDVDTTAVTGEPNEGVSGAWVTPSGAGLNLETTMVIDGLGRTVRVIDPSDKNTDTFYNDTAHEVHVYHGWSAGTKVGPIEITREYRPLAGAPSGERTVYIEHLTSSASSNAYGTTYPVGDETIDSSNIQSVTRELTNDAGQVTETDAYVSLSGVTYSQADAHLGTAGTNYLATLTDYEARGNVKRVQAPDGTITRYVYDPLNRLLSTWIGTDDTPTSGFWSPVNQAGTNLVKVSTIVYDNNGVGDGNVTKSSAVITHDATTGADTSSYATDYQYDFRNRLIQSRGPDGVAQKLTLDNLGRATAVETYADSDSDFVIDSLELRGKDETFFDEKGQIYKTVHHEVSPSTGTIGDHLTTNFWFDGRGNLIKSKNPNALFSKAKFDGAGRQVASYTSYESGETSYSDADDVVGDTVIEQQKTIYDTDSRPVTTTGFMRLETDTTSTGELTPTNSYIQTSVTWYDDADRTIGSATYGRDNGTTRYVFNTSGNLIHSNSDGIPDEAVNTPRLPNTSDDYFATKIEYDSAGRAYRATDNKGHITQTNFDLLGRQTKVIENYTDGTASETETDTDRTTEWIYDSSGRLSTLRAKNPKGSGNGVENQDTKYLYESDINRSWVTSAIYPDSSDTTSAGTDQEKCTYDRLGRKLTETDQRGVVHTYSYDSAGRLQSDAVTTLPSGVDGTVRRIDTTYDDLSRKQKVTSYNNTAGTGTPVNEVKFTYDGWGDVIKDEQDHDSAVGAGSPAVQYTYSDGAVSGEAKYVRLDSITYADGRVVYYNYPSSGVGNALMRLDNIANDSSGTTKYVQYTYLGAGAVVKETHPQVTNGLVLDYSQGGTYAGWDRFMRVIDQKWTNTAGTTTIDEYQYAYDRASNRLSRDNTTTTGKDEYYTYDGLNRLSGYNRGNLSSGAITDAAANFNQKWTLDSLGNWRSFQWDDTGGGNSYTTQSRASNSANETGAITGTGADWLDPVYDAAGNMSSSPKPTDGSQRAHYAWDGWNRLAAVYNDNGGVPGTLSQTYQYDGLGRRTQGFSQGSGATQDYYYDTRWRMLQQQISGTGAKPEEYIWSERYSDSPVLRFRDTDNNGSMDETLYYTTDANNNVTSLVQTTGTVKERYTYDPYGKPYYYNASWSSLSDTAVSNRLLYGGSYHLGGSNGLYYIRNRYYHPTLGRFISRDPLEYMDGMNLNEYVQSNPVAYTDPSGLRTRKTFSNIVRGATSAKSTYRSDEVNGYDAGLQHYVMEGGKTAALSPSLLADLKKYKQYRELVDNTIPNLIRKQLPTQCYQVDKTLTLSNTMFEFLTAPWQADPKTGRFYREDFYSFNLNTAIGTIHSIKWTATFTVGSSAKDTNCCCLAYAKNIKVHFVLDDDYTFNTGVKDAPFQVVFGMIMGGKDYHFHNEWDEFPGPQTSKICNVKR
jgi:RHS repeat-associated protein